MCYTVLHALELHACFSYEMEIWLDTWKLCIVCVEEAAWVRQGDHNRVHGFDRYAHNLGQANINCRSECMHLTHAQEHAANLATAMQGGEGGRVDMQRHLPDSYSCCKIIMFLILYCQYIPKHCTLWTSWRVWYIHVWRAQNQSQVGYQNDKISPKLIAQKIEYMYTLLL